MKFNKKILTSLLAVGVLFSITIPNAVKASGEEGVTIYALTDPAFPTSSQPLHNAIIDKYGIEIDTDNNGIISIGEANLFTGSSTWNWLLLDGSSVAEDSKITGTLYGIEHFTGITYLRISDHKLTGSIPEDIGNLTNLKRIFLGHNQLDGAIPASIGNLVNLQELFLQNNKLDDEIPASIGNLSSLTRLSLEDNNFSGTFPDSLYNLPLQLLDVSGNLGLSGNLTEGFKNNSTLTYLDVSETNVIQAQPDIPSLLEENGGTFVYNNLAENLLNSDGTLKDGITHEDIDKAQESANHWNEPTKSEWQTKIDQAQELLYQRDAENAVNDLFDTDGTIKDTVIQEDIEDAQDLVDKVTDAEKKKELQDKLDDAQKQLDQRDFVVIEGFKTFTGTGTVSTTIDAPVEKFSKVYVDGKLLPSSNYVVTSGSTVITLNEAYLKILENGTYDFEVEFVSGAKVSVPLTVDVKTITDPIDPVDPVDPTNPTDPVKPTDPTTPTNPIVTKPSVDGKPSVADGTTVSGNNSVNTGDETNTMMLYAMLATSLLGLIVVIKRRKETE